MTIDGGVWRAITNDKPVQFLQLRGGNTMTKTTNDREVKTDDMPFGEVGERRRLKLARSEKDKPTLVSQIRAEMEQRKQQNQWEKNS